MSDVLVICPTRNRPELLEKTYQSMVRTSTIATLAIYIDDDQVEQYAAFRDRPRLIMESGPRVGPAPAVNKIVERHPGFGVYGLITDDSEIETPAWDEYVVAEISRMPGHIGVVSAMHPFGDWVNFAYVSNRWISALGWFACPGMVHFCWDTLIELLGEATTLVRSSRSQFFINHQGMTSGHEAFAADAQVFVSWCGYERRKDIGRLIDARERLS